MKKRLKNSDDAAKYRKELLAEQHGIDPILKIKITKPVLDHYHQENQHCRGVLQNEVNGWEGRVQNSFNRCVRHLTDKPLYEVLRNLADYLEKHNNIPEEEQVIHHTALTIDVKRFKALPAKQQIEILEGLGLVAESNVKKRGNQIRTQIKLGNFNINDIKK